LEYQASGNEKEAMTLEKVLFTVLQANDRDLEALEKARQKNQGGFLWSMIGGGSQAVAKPVQPRLQENVVIDNRKYFNINIGN
jgi:hypothetical protein